mmetsp:Transcript_32522/g.85408  ORF Transcript_32522/g.85408 Transcript_32522/m.85408 type:complete len:235 (-) Transcript_32522:690-1394(-)
MGSSSSSGVRTRRFAESTPACAPERVPSPRLLLWPPRPRAPRGLEPLGPLPEARPTGGGGGIIPEASIGLGSGTGTASLPKPPPWRVRGENGTDGGAAAPIPDGAAGVRATAGCASSWATLSLPRLTVRAPSFSGHVRVNSAQSGLRSRSSSAAYNVAYSMSVFTIHSRRSRIPSIVFVTASSRVASSSSVGRMRRRRSRAMKVPVRPTPAEQWQIAQCLCPRSPSSKSMCSAM